MPLVSVASPKVYELNDTTIHVTSVAPVFIIKLKSNPTTGYTWSLHDYDKTLLSLVKHQYLAPTSGLIGASGYDQWTFKMNKVAFTQPQRTSLKLTYARPWDKSDGATAVEFVVTT
jgi:inhibitor of cysteine peptidase